MAASLNFRFSCRVPHLFGNFSVKMNYSVFICILLSSAILVGSVDRPRGVSLSKMSFYNPAKLFTCLDGSLTIEFERVNDDYCDCRDGSDEPGTSACPNGVFTCQNKGYTPTTIPASRVNDGICDCCDGLDEYSKHNLCENTCLELGRAMREEEEKKRQRLVDGNIYYLEYKVEAEKAQKQNKERLEQLVKEKETIEVERKELEEKKNQAEEPEKAAKDVHENAWKEEKAKRDAEKDEQKAEAAFKEMDKDEDGSLTIQEVSLKPEFDTDGDGALSAEEAKKTLSDNESVDLKTFKDQIWTDIKYKYLEPSPPLTDTPTPEDEHVKQKPRDPDADASGTDHDAEDLNEEDDEDEEGHEGPKHLGGHDEDMGDVDDKLPENKEEDSEDKMPDYDEETHKLIEAADVARTQFNDVDQKFRDVETEIRQLEEVASLDFGSDLAFYHLKGQCYEFTDREYTYKLCPFDRASQRSKNGGHETSLGRWGKWAGPDADIYSHQKYEHGLNCWNGPDRSMTVSLYCGGSNELTAVTEPSRCEYHADFYTPALCHTIPPPIEKDPAHDEL